MKSQSDLVCLFEADEQTELALVRSLLSAQGIDHVVQGEHHAAMVAGLFGNPAIKPRVLVAQRDLELARELLAASPVGEGPAQGEAATLEGAVCPVHEQPAMATCDRCGTFLCAQCKTAGAATCEDCAKLDDAEMGKRSSRGRNFRRAVVLAILALTALGLLLPLLS